MQQDLSRMLSLPLPLFCSHLTMAALYWSSVLRRNDWAIDATCGNGRDALQLATLLQGEGSGLIALDIQEVALERTRARLEGQLEPEVCARVHLLHTSHAHLPECGQVKCIVYNLGYLPGGDKAITTHTESTLQSLQHACRILVPGGIVSIMCYPGHEEGARETEAVLGFAQGLDPKLWRVLLHSYTQGTSKLGNWTRRLHDFFVLHEGQCSRTRPDCRTKKAWESRRSPKPSFEVPWVYPHQEKRPALLLFIKR